MAHADLDRRVVVAKARQEAGDAERLHRLRLHHPERDRAAQPGPDLAHRVLGEVDRLEHVARLRQQRPAGVGQLAAAVAAGEELGAQLPLQRQHRRRDRGLDQVQAVGGAGEAALLGDGDESA